MENIFKCLTILSVFYTLFPIIVGITKYKYFHPNLKLIFLLVCVGFLVDLLCGYFCYLLVINNLIYIYSYTFFEIVVLTIFYKNNFESLFLKSLMMLILILFIVYAAFVIYQFGFSSTKNMQIVAVENILVFCFVFFSLFKFLRVKPEIVSVKSSFFWIFSAHLVFFSVEVLYYLFFDYLNKNQPYFLFTLSHVLHDLLMILYNTLLAIGFLKSKNKNHEIKTE